MIAPAQGMALFDKALTRRQAQLVVVPLESARRRQVVRSVRPAGVAGAGPAHSGAGRGRERQLGERARRPAGRAAGRGRDPGGPDRGRARSVPGESGRVPIDRPLRELGLDSLMAVELRNALGRRAGATLPPTLAFDHPTPAAIARFLLSEVPSLSKRSAPRGRLWKSRTEGTSRLDPAPRRPPGQGAQARPPVPRGERPADRIETIPMGERWLADGFRVIPTPGGFAQRMVDMTQAMEALAALAEAGLRASLTHVLVRAAALALARNPRLHQSVVRLPQAHAGGGRYRPVDGGPDDLRARRRPRRRRPDAAAGAGGNRRGGDRRRSREGGRRPPEHAPHGLDDPLRRSSAGS